MEIDPSCQNTWTCKTSHGPRLPPFLGVIDVQIETLALHMGMCYVLRNHGSHVGAYASRATCTCQQKIEWYLNEGRSSLVIIGTPGPTADSALSFPGPCYPVFSAASLSAATESLPCSISAHFSLAQQDMRLGFCGLRTAHPRHRRTRSEILGRSPRYTRDRW